MIRSRPVATAVAGMALARIIGAALNLLLVPILFRSLASDELGLWMLLSQSRAFIGLMDLGFAVTVTRRVAVIFGRRDAGADAAACDVEMADLLTTSRRVARYLSVASSAVMWCVGAAFLSRLSVAGGLRPPMWTAWTILCLSYGGSVWASYWSCLAQGAGLVAADVLASALVSAAVIVGQILVVRLGGGLEGLAIAAVIGVVVARLVSYLIVSRRRPELTALRGRWRSDLVREAWPLAVRAWLTIAGGFLILKTDDYFIAYFRGASLVPAYSAAYQLVWTLSVFAITAAAASATFISRLWHSGRLDDAKAIVLRNLRLGMSIMTCGIACLLVAGSSITDVWLGRGHFVGMDVLAVFCVMLTLETQHVIIATSSRATEDEPFAAWAVGAGILNLVLTWWLITPLGLFGVALATCLAQAATNNWYAVYRGLRRLRMPIMATLVRGTGPAVALGSVAYALGRAAVAVVPHAASPLVAIAASAAPSAVVLLLGSWWVVARGAAPGAGAAASSTGRADPAA